MYRRQPKTVLLLVIAMIIQLFTVTVASAQAASMKAGVALNGDGLHGHAFGKSADASSHQASANCSLAADSSVTPASDDCTKSSNCLLEHCSSAHALTKPFHPPLYVEGDSLRLRFSPQPRLLPLPPRARPPKSA